MAKNPRILDNLAKNKKEKLLDIDVVDNRGRLDIVHQCPKCNIDMHYWTNTKGQVQGLMCPNCQLTYDPNKPSQRVEVKVKRRMSTVDKTVEVATIDYRRAIDSVENVNAKTMSDLYTPRNDSLNASVTKKFESMEYAGRKKKLDPDDELLKKQGFTILDTYERMPT